MLRHASQCHTRLVYISFIPNGLFTHYASLCVSVQRLIIRLLIDWSQVDRSLPRPQQANLQEPVRDELLTSSSFKVRVQSSVQKTEPADEAISFTLLS